VPAINLAELMNRSPGSRSAVEADLRLWDERFRAATIEEARPHLPLEGDSSWWQYRSARQWRKPATEELDNLRTRKTVK